MATLMDIGLRCELRPIKLQFIYESKEQNILGHKRKNQDCRNLDFKSIVITEVFTDTIVIDPLGDQGLLIAQRK